jgi:pimeloyl-ACP methyl ester carboxylesterase
VTSGRVAVNGMRMYYEVSGAGEPLVVLHGAYMKMDAVGLPRADVFGYSMGAVAGLQLAIRHPAKVNKLVAASVAYDVRGWQPEFIAFIPQMTVEMISALPFAKEYEKLAANPKGFPELAHKLIALEKEPMAWEADVRTLATPVLIITGDADIATLEHSVAMFRLLGGGIMGDMGKPLPASRLAVLPATSHGRNHAARSAAGLDRAVPEGCNAEGFLRVIGILLI